MKKRNYLTLGLISLTGLAVGIVSLSAVNSFKFNADGPAATNWKHFAAVMPTETTQGIREYWINCAGEYQPYFTKPEGVTAKDETLTADQISTILANQKDERIIPTLGIIQKGVTKGYDGSSAYHHDFVEAAYAYTYLDSTTKAKITGWNDNLAKGKAEWDSHFKVVYHAGKDSIPANEQAAYTWSKTFDEDYGYVFKIDAVISPAAATPYVQFYSYGYGASGVTYNSIDKIHFAIKSPFSTTAGTSQTTWCGNYGTAKKISLSSVAGWSKINEYGSDLNTDGQFNTSFAGALSIQRYHAAFAEEYSCSYYLSSIYVENLSEDGAIVQSTNNSIVEETAWTSGSGTITKNVSTPYGTAVQIDFSNKSTVFEAKWSGVDIKRAQAFDYLELYVYAPVSNEAFFVSQQSWRNAVMNVNVLPSASDNGEKADAAAGSTAILSQGWNKISFPVQQFQDNNYYPSGTMYFEIWNRTSGSQNGWLVTDIKGYKTPDVQPTATAFAYSFTGSVESYEESSYPGVPFYKASVSAHKAVDRFAVVVNQPSNLSKYTSVKFIVKGPRTGSFALFYDFIKGAWWPVGEQVTSGVTSDAYSEITYKASDINTGFSWASLKMGLLFIGSGNNATGDWYFGIQLIK